MLRSFLDTIQKPHVETTSLKILRYEIWSHQWARVLQTAVNNKMKLVSFLRRHKMSLIWEDDWVLLKQAVEFGKGQISDWVQ